MELINSSTLTIILILMLLLTSCAQQHSQPLTNDDVTPPKSEPVKLNSINNPSTKPSTEVKPAPYSTKTNKQIRPTDDVLTQMNVDLPKVKPSVGFASIDDLVEAFALAYQSHDIASGLSLMYFDSSDETTFSDRKKLYYITLYNEFFLKVKKISWTDPINAEEVLDIQTKTEPKYAIPIVGNLVIDYEQAPDGSEQWSWDIIKKNGRFFLLCSDVFFAHHRSSKDYKFSKVLY